MKTIVFLCAAICTVLGFYLTSLPPALPLHTGADGQPVYPVSSGSDDLHLLAFALQAFLLAAAVAAVALICRKNLFYCMFYGLNLVLLGVAVFLVSLDTPLSEMVANGPYALVTALAVAPFPLMIAVFKHLKAV
ncbi:hypothetical protein [Neisseria sp.]|uniref:hypothetical protein n=1 Tax=Neisseria sp. TaxID=192066 RepID=UPI0035A17DC2